MILIEKEPLQQQLENLAKSWRGTFSGPAYTNALERLKNAPAVDAVLVVRCKDCKHCKMCYPEKQIGKESTQGWFCKGHKSYRKPDDFCSYGERREGE